MPPPPRALHPGDGVFRPNPLVPRRAAAYAATMTPHPLPRERLLYVDWLRIAAFALLVLYHVGMLYVPWHFHVKHQPTYAALEPLMRLSNPWRMGLLFVISGVATGLMLGRPGLARERSRRLLLPLLLGHGGHRAAAGLAAGARAVRLRRQLSRLPAPVLQRLRRLLPRQAVPGAAHLEPPVVPSLPVVPTRCCCCWRCACCRRRALQRAADAIRRACRAGAAAGCCRCCCCGGRALLLFPRFGETHALLDDWAAHAAYAPLFAFGVLLARRRVLLARLQALRWPALALGLAGWVVLVLYPGMLPGWPAVPEA